VSGHYRPTEIKQMRGNVIFEYKGYFYCPWDELEPDNRKTYHEVKKVDEHNNLKYAFDVPLTPYIMAMTEEAFRKWIDMGMPTRDEMGGHQVEDHERYYDKWVDEQIEKELLYD